MGKGRGREGKGKGGKGKKGASECGVGGLLDILIIPLLFFFFSFNE